MHTAMGTDPLRVGTDIVCGAPFCWNVRFWNKVQHLEARDEPCVCCCFWNIWFESLSSFFPFFFFELTNNGFYLKGCYCHISKSTGLLRWKMYWFSQLWMLFHFYMDSIAQHCWLNLLRIRNRGLKLLPSFQCDCASFWRAEWHNH